MKRGRVLVRVLALGVLVGMLAFGLAGVGVAFQNEPEGFRGLKWGDPPGEDMVNEWSINPDFVWYRRAGDKMKIGRANLLSIHYAFYKGQFFFVEITVGIDPTETSHYDYLKDVLILKFGQGNPEGRQGIRWDGETTIIVLQSLSGTLSIYSRKIYFQKKDDEKDEAREGAEEGLDDF